MSQLKLNFNKEKTVETKLERITPDKASKYLKSNHVNRPIRSTHIDYLAREMKDGRWKLNGASIVFNGDNLMDGQHRLHAVISSGTPIDTIVVRGADKCSLPTIDTGKVRTGGDALHIVGESNANILATAARMAILYQKREFLRRVRTSNAEVVGYVRANPGLSESVAHVRRAKTRILFSASHAAMLHYFMVKKDKDIADSLFLGIGQGFQPDAGETFLALREKLISCMKAPSKMDPRILSIYVIKAWDAKRRGKRLRIFKFTAGEDVPRIR